MSKEKQTLTAYLWSFNVAMFSWVSKFHILHVPSQLPEAKKFYLTSKEFTIPWWPSNTPDISPSIDTIYIFPSAFPIAILRPYYSKNLILYMALSKKSNFDNISLVLTSTIYTNLSKVPIARYYPWKSIHLRHLLEILIFCLKNNYIIKS